MQEVTEQVTEQLPILLIPQLWIRIVCIVILVGALTFFINPMLLGIRHAGCYAGTAVCVLGIAFFVWNEPIAHLLDKVWKNEDGRILLCIVAGFLALCVILAVFISICMGVSAAKKPKEESPVVVLGCKVRGTSPSLMLQRRLETAYAYLTAHPNVPVIVCGGQGKDEAISEAQCMAEYLEQKGIAKERIFREETSVSTRENLTNAKAILEREELGYKITIVTDGFHQYRAHLIAKDCGLKNDAVSAKTPWYLVPSYWVREWMGVFAFFIFG